MPHLHSHWISAGNSGATGCQGAIFPYWSFTKTAIAICALRLADRGLIALEDRAEGQPYSLRHLLAHQSGLRDYGQVAAYHHAVAAGQQPWSRAQVIAITTEKPPLFEAGQGWSYSNLGYMFAKEMLEKASGQSLADLITAEICAPLGLASVRLATTPRDFAAVHWPAAATYNPAWVYHGCLTGTASDAARLLHALFTQPLFTQPLVTPALLKAMCARHPLGGALPGRPWSQCGYALGLMSGQFGAVGRAIGHSGAGPFCVNAVYHFPDLKAPVTVASFTCGTDEGVAEHECARIADSL